MSTDAMPNGESDLYPVELLTISFPLSFSSFNLCEGGQEVILLHITNMTHSRGERKRTSG